MTDASNPAAAPFILRLYISAAAPRSSRAVVNTRLFCETYLAGRYELEILNIADNVHLAAQDQIVAAPTLVKMAPTPIRRFIGDMSDVHTLLSDLGIEKPPAAPMA